MRIKKYAIGGTVTSYPSYNNMPIVNLPEAEVLGMRTGQEINRPFWYNDNTAEWEANRFDELQRARDAYDMGYKQVPSFMDPKAIGKAESFSPITYVHPAGDLEAILQAAGYALEGDIPSAALAGSLAAASVFLPGTFQTKSTMAGGVLERSLDKNGRIHPNAIRAIIDSPQTSPAEKQVLSDALEEALINSSLSPGVLDETTGRINYKEFKESLENYIPTLKAKPNSQYANYGVEKVFDEDRMLDIGSHPDRVPTYTGIFDKLYDSDYSLPGQFHRELDAYFNRNKDWFVGRDLGDAYSDGYLRTDMYYDRTRLKDFFDALLEGDVESLGLPPIDIDPNAHEGYFRPHFERARDLFDGNYLQTEMIGLHPDVSSPYAPIPVSDAHLDDPGFGHFRAVYDPKDPEVANIIEIQSDAATEKGDIARSLRAPHTYMIDDGDFFNSNVSGYFYNINPRQELDEALSQSNPLEYFRQKPMFSDTDQVLTNYVNGLLPSYSAVDPKTGALLHSSEDLDILRSINDKLSSGEKISIDDVETLRDLQIKERDRLENEKLRGIQNKITEEIKPLYQKLIDENPRLFASDDAYLMAQRQAASYVQGDNFGLNAFSPEKQAIIRDLIEQGRAVRGESQHAQAKIQALQNISVFNNADLAYALEEDLANLSRFDLELFDKKLNNPVRKSLIKNYTERVLQEAVSDITSRNPGVKKIRIPVGETAAKIQGHSGVRGSTKKYNSMDKTIKRVFGKKPGKVTDDRGNQWWEFDLPEGGFEKQIFNRGGKINVVKKRTGKYRVKKS